MYKMVGAGMVSIYGYSGHDHGWNGQEQDCLGTTPQLLIVRIPGVATPGHIFARNAAKIKPFSLLNS